MGKRFLMEIVNNSRNVIVMSKYCWEAAENEANVSSAVRVPFAAKRRRTKGAPFLLRLD